jgi:MarR family transcriptional regulator, transcriptional regulator for hemolysin
MPFPTDRHHDMSLQIARIARIRRRTADRLLATHKLSEATAHPLIILLRRGEAIGQGELAEEMGIEGPSLVRLIDLLEKEALVERRGHPNDRRAKLLFLTPKGKAKADKVNRIFEEGREQLFQNISNHELAVAIDVLSKLELSCVEFLRQPVKRKRVA